MKWCKHPVSLVLLVIFPHQRITDGYCLSMSSEIKIEYNDKYIHSSSFSYYFFFTFVERHKYEIQVKLTTWKKFVFVKNINYRLICDFASHLL